MTDVVSFDPKSRYGKTAERWGNLLLPEGAAHVDTRFVFEGEREAAYRGLRVNVVPKDPAKRLYYYLRTADIPTTSARARKSRARRGRAERGRFSDRRGFRRAGERRGNRRTGARSRRSPRAAWQSRGRGAGAPVRASPVNRCSRRGSPRDRARGRRAPE